MIVQRKLFGKSNDLVSLVLLGSEESNNILDYPNIEVQFPMATASWEMLEFLEKQVRPTNVNADWLDAMVVGMQFIKDEIDGANYNITSKKLILFTNFCTPVSDDQVHIITKGFSHLEIEIIIIGPDVTAGLHSADLGDDATSSSVQNKKTECQKSGEALISRIVTQVGGVICSFVEAIPQLQYFETKKVKPAPWNVLMDIGPDVNIPVTGYKKIAKVSLPSWKLELASTDAGIVKEKSYFRQDAEQKVVKKEDIIDGYTFGSTIVPFSDLDKSQLKYQSGKRCLSVIGVTKASNIPRHLLVGDGCYYIVPQKGVEEAAVALSAFILSLYDTNMVGIARRVYNNNGSPHMSVLFPKVRPDYQCLVLIDLPFCEDVRHYKFPSLNKVKVNDEQVKCIDNLIDKMDLMTAVQHAGDEPSEAFHPKRNLDPYHQHFYQAMCVRGLNPDAPIPNLNEATAQLLESPFNNNQEVSNALSDIKNHFKLTVKKQAKLRKKAEDIFKISSDVASTSTNVPVSVASSTTMADITESTVVRIGTVNPVGDFKTLLVGNQPFRNIATEMENVITKLVLNSFGSNEYDKAMSSLCCLRESCVSKEVPVIFNDWIVGFKEELLAREKRSFWNIISEGQVGLITSAESPASSVDTKTAADFYTISENITDEDNGIHMDEEDLLDDL